MKQQFAAKHPWTILAAGAAIQVLTGLPAAWGVFQQPVMEEYGLSEQGAGYAFALLIAAFGVGCVLGGFLQDKKGPRCAALWGTALLCGGFFAAAFLPGWAGGGGSFWPSASRRGWARRFCTHPSSPAPKSGTRGARGWRPGSSAERWDFPARSLPCSFGRRCGDLARYRASGAPFGHWVRLLCRCALRAARCSATRRRKNSSQAAKTPSTFLRGRCCAQSSTGCVRARYAFSTPAVLLFSPIILKLGMERGLDEGAALWSVVLGSVGSAAGRLLMPLLSDRIGRRATDLGLFAASLGLSAAFWAARGWWVVVCYAGLTFCYSALAAVLPALSTDLFGLPHAGVNYGFLALGQSVGSLAFPFAANLLALENGRHLLAMAGAAAGFAAIWALHPVQKDPR